MELYLKNFSNPSFFVLVFIAHGCGERMFEVLIEEEEVVN